MVKWCIVNFVGFVWGEIFCIWAMDLFESRIGKTFEESLWHILTKSARTTTQCCDKWDKMKKKYFQEKTTQGVTCSTTTSWVWFHKMNQNLEAQQRQMAHLMDLIRIMFMLNLLKHQPLKKIYQMMIQVQVKLGMFVTTLALGSWPRQGLAKVRTKNETWESHFMLLGMWESVKEWTSTLPSEFPLWELEFWWTPKFSKSNYMGQNRIEYFLI
jgi:hypothetical protein